MNNYIHGSETPNYRDVDVLRNALIENGAKLLIGRTKRVTGLRGLGLKIKWIGFAGEKNYYSGRKPCPGSKNSHNLYTKKKKSV